MAKAKAPRRSSKAKRPGRNPGRTSLCTPEMAERIGAMIEAGSGLETAARRAGLGDRTVHRWMEKGEEPVDGDGNPLPLDPKMERYRQFRRRIQAARDSFEVEIDDVLVNKGLRSKHEPTAVHTAQWLGERLLPNKYGRRQEVRNTGPDGGPVKVDATLSGTVEVRPIIPPEAIAAWSPEQIAAAFAALDDKGGK